MKAPFLCCWKVAVKQWSSASVKQSSSAAVKQCWPSNNRWTQLVHVSLLSRKVLTTTFRLIRVSTSPSCTGPRSRWATSSRPSRPSSSSDYSSGEIQGLIMPKYLVIDNNADNTERRILPTLVFWLYVILGEQHIKTHLKLICML